MLRLQHELKDLFGSWLKTHYPERASLVISLIRQLHGGRDYDSRFGTRQTGNGTLAQLIAQRFELACRRHTLARGSEAPLNTDLFKSPSRPGDQFKLL